MIYEVRTRFDLEPDVGDDLGPDFIANLVGAHFGVGWRRRRSTRRGVTVYVQPRGAKVHVETEVPA